MTDWMIDPSVLKRKQGTCKKIIQIDKSDEGVHDQDYYVA